MRSPRKYLQALIAMRSELMRQKLSPRNVMEISMAIRNLKPWLDAYPKATDEQVARHMLRHKNAVITLLPGGDMPNSQAMRIEFLTIINTYCNARIPQASHASC